MCHKGKSQQNQIATEKWLKISHFAFFNMQNVWCLQPLQSTTAPVAVPGILERRNAEHRADEPAQLFEEQHQP